MSEVVFPRAAAVIEGGIESGAHLGAVLAITRRGTLLGELALGQARSNVLMATDSIVLWMSSSKPIGAVAMLQQVERGKLSLDDHVAGYLPDFAAGGKDAVTIRHLLTHTCGFRWVDLRGAETSWQEIIARICAAPLESGWIVGEKAGYHPYTSWFILGELIRIVDGRPFEQYVREEIFLPLGMQDSWIGMPLDHFEAYGSRIAITYENERPSKPVHRYSTPGGVTHCVPGGNGHGPVQELLRFYQMLLGGGELDGARILAANTVAEMIRRQREGIFDTTFRHTLDFGYGLIINSARYGEATVPYGYGPKASDATFGHSGVQSSAAFADPERQLAVAIVFNGMPGEARHQLRIRKVLAALEEDLARL